MTVVAPPVPDAVAPSRSRGVRALWRAGLLGGASTVLWLLVVIERWEQIRGLFADLGAAENLVALLFLALWPVATFFATRAGVRGALHPPPREGMGVWRLAWRAFQQNPRGVAGLGILALIYAVAFLCPVLADYGMRAVPSRDTLVNEYLPPGSTVWVFGDRRRGECYALSWKKEGDALVLDRGKGEPRRVRMKDLGEPRRGWSRGGVRTIRIGDRDVPYRIDRHLLGTDRYGHDLLTRIIYGSRISLTIGFAAMLIAVTFGTLSGVLAGYFGGFVDGLVMRFVDVLLAFPRLLLLLLIVAIYQGASVLMIAVVLGVTGWMGVSRLVRAEVLRLKEIDFIASARAMGFSKARIMLRHLVPNAMAPVIVAATLMVGTTILVESALSFLGMGVPLDTPTWGNIVYSGQGALQDAWWVATIPGIAIVVTVVSFNLAGDALRDALDPRQRV